jgi:hypothetical protein
MRKPPSWFTKKLRATDATLGVRDAGPKGWQVVQRIPTVVTHGVWEGNMIREVKRIWDHVGYIPDLTGAFLDELPRYNTGRYKDFRSFCEGTGIYYAG